MTLDPIKTGLLNVIAEPTAKGEGFRHLWLGDSRMGKTYANDILIKWLLKHRKIDLILTIDEKNAWEVQYKGGIERVNPAHLIEVKAGEQPGDPKDKRHIVFRGIAATKTPGPGVDNIIFDVANMGWEIIRVVPKTKVVLNVDELSDATNGGQHWRDDAVATLYRKGGGVGISVIATTQLPQTLPREAFALPETIGIFRMSGREAEYLAEKRVISPSDIPSIEQLKVGEFRLFRKSVSLDPNIYRFGA